MLKKRKGILLFLLIYKVVVWIEGNEFRQQKMKDQKD